MCLLRSRCYRSESAKRSTIASDHDGVFTMTVAHGTDRLKSARLVLRRIAPDDLPFFTRIQHSPKSRSIIPEAARPRPKSRPHGCRPLSKAMTSARSHYLAVLRKEEDGSGAHRHPLASR